MRKIFLVTMTLFVFLLRSFAVMASEMSKENRERQENSLSQDRVLLEERRSELPSCSVEILETYCASSRNELDGDDYACILNLLKTYRLCLEEEREARARGEKGFVGVLWQEFRVDYGMLPSIAGLICNQSDNIHPEKKLELVNKISCIAPKDIGAHEEFTPVLEHWWPYPAIIRFCERKEAAGYGYYRFIRVKMLVHYQCQLIEEASIKKYKDVVDKYDLCEYYEPALVKHEQFELAMQEARTDPDLNAFRLRDYAKVMAIDAHLAVQKKEEILEFLEFARKIALDHVKEEKEQKQKQKQDQNSISSEWEYTLRDIAEFKARLLRREDTPRGRFYLWEFRAPGPSKIIEAKLKSGEWQQPRVEVLDAIPGDCSCLEGD